MITEVSALLDQKTRKQVLSDPARRSAIATLHEAGLREDEVAEALNCHRMIVTRFLLPAHRRLDRVQDQPRDGSIAAWDLQSYPRNEQALFYDRPPKMDAALARKQEKFAGLFGLEVRRWLRGLELSHAERQHVIEQAALRLDESPLNFGGEYMFSVDRVVAELLGIWRPDASSVSDRDLKSLIGRWLASWISFWIWEPPIWYRALDLEFAYFGSNPQAAKPQNGYPGAVGCHSREPYISDSPTGRAFHV